MTLGIMQPYFFPYLGYWQLMNAVDKYYLLDDVNFIKRGYINRNRIQINRQPHYFGLRIRDISQNKLICEHEICLDNKEIKRLLSMITFSYSKAPFYKKTYEHIREVLEFGLLPEGRNLADFLANANRLTAKALGITTIIQRTSRDVQLEGELHSEARIIAICKYAEATVYLNAIGGRQLYSSTEFQKNGIDLRFLRMNDKLQYPQFEEYFVPNLSVIDVMMFCDDDVISKLLGMYSIET